MQTILEFDLCWGWLFCTSSWKWPSAVEIALGPRLSSSRKDVPAVASTWGGLGLSLGGVELVRTLILLPGANGSSFLCRASVLQHWILAGPSGRNSWL